ncbi:hypothetical protein C8Q75DRAFT_577590 [Abortiporus biennis]|nr:hypothetical protein C8Q75DRAFT_577590 [Abortiporus biennis]
MLLLHAPDKREQFSHGAVLASKFIFMAMFLICVVSGAKSGVYFLIVICRIIPWLVMSSQSNISFTERRDQIYEIRFRRGGSRIQRSSKQPVPCDIDFGAKDSCIFCGGASYYVSRRRLCNLSSSRWK